MSIHLRSVRKTTGPSSLDKPLFDGLDMNFQSGAHVGVLGVPKSGKSTLLRIICGTESVDAGAVSRTLNVSWPIPLTSFFLKTSSVAANIRFAARMYGIGDSDFPQRVAELGKIVEFLNVKLQNCPRFVRPRLAFALGIGIDFEMSLFDERVVPRDDDFKEHGTRIVERYKATRGLVVATKTPAEVEAHCDTVYVLEDGRANYFSSVADGVERFKEVVKAGQEKRKGDGAPGPESGDDGDVGETSDIDMIGAAIE
jgi:capsular polysaccharide transport system ATP-binding protein